MIFCQFVRLILGSTGRDLILAVSIWIVFFLWLSFNIITKEDTNTTKGVLSRNLVIRHKKNNYFSCVLFCFSMYWGCCFAGEVVRIGLGIVLLFFAMALIIRKRVWLSIFPLVIAAFMHQSTIVFIPGLILICFLKRYPNRNKYIMWFFVMILADVLIGITGLFDIQFLIQVLSRFSYLGFISRFFEYTNSAAGAYFSSQYVFYHLLALLLLFGDLESEDYQRITFLYYIGLSLGTVFQKTVIVMRIEWIYLSVICFAFYYMIRDSKKFTDYTKFAIVSGYGVLQTIMMIRYLGCVW